MAYAVEVTLGTGNKVSLNYQSQEVSVSITYRLEREDKDLRSVVEEKAGELVAAHELACKRVKGENERSSETPEEVEGGLVSMSFQSEAATTANQGATIAQAQLLRALWRQAGWGEDALQARLRLDCGCQAPQDLSYEQAAALLVALGEDERGRFQNERTRSQANRLPGEETNSSPPMC